MDKIPDWLKFWESKIVKTSAAGTGSAVGVTAAMNAAIHGIGFGLGGVVKGSIAAAVHSWIGNVAAGSLFAGLQSLGATGGLAIFGPIGVGVGTTAGVSYWWYSGSSESPDSGASDSGSTDRPESGPLEERDV